MGYRRPTGRQHASFRRCSMFSWHGGERLPKYFAQWQMFSFGKPPHKVTAAEKPINTLTELEIRNCTWWLYLICNASSICIHLVWSAVFNSMWSIFGTALKRNLTACFESESWRARVVSFTEPVKFCSHRQSTFGSLFSPYYLLLSTSVFTVNTLPLWHSRGCHSN